MLKVEKKVIDDEIITLDQAKSWMRVTYDNDDDLIEDLITQSRDLIENYLNISILQTQITLTATARKRLTPPFGDVGEIHSVKDRDGNNLDYTWNGFEIIFEPSQWSPTQPETPEYVETITVYDAKFHRTIVGLKLPLLEIIAYLYENRGDTINYDNLLTHNKYLEQYRKKIWI